jgi:hypothetical protein
MIYFMVPDRLQRFSYVRSRVDFACEESRNLTSFR